MIKPHLSLIAICLFLLSCHSRTEQMLSDIDALLNQKPDSALAALKRVDVSRLSRTKDKAYYSLLISAALDKNYIDVADDSIICRATEYYAQHGPAYNRMRSYYYQGIVRINNKDYPSAIVSLEKAEKEAKSLHDYRYLGLIYRNIGSIFHATNNYKQAEDYTKRAISCFTNNKDTVYVLYSIYSLAVSYLNSAEGYNNRDDLDSSLLYINKILVNAPNETLRAYSNIRYAQAQVIKGDSLQRAINVYQKMPKSRLTYRDYGYCAYAYAKTGQVDSAKKWADMAFRAARTRPQKAVLNSLLFRVDTLEGRYHDALRKVINAMAVQDSVTRVLLQQSLSVAQKNYFQSENALHISQIKRQRQLFSFIGIIFLLLIVSLLLFMQNRKQKQEALLREQMAQLAVTQQRIQKDSGSLVGALFMEKSARLFGLSHEYFEAEDEDIRSQALLEFKQVARELAETPELFLELENHLNQYCSGIMDKLQMQVPRIKGTNRKIIALFFAGIPDTLVQSIMRRSSVGSLRTLRSRFRQTIKEAHAPEEALFLAMLETEKQPGKN